MSYILIVEDEPVIRGALRKLLERHEYSVCEADSVEDAEQEHKLADFDLIISDLRLPGAPGTDIIERARPAPVLIMTSYASLRSAVDAMKQGAVDYIAKPFDHDEMVMAVERVIKEQSLSRRNRALQQDVARTYPTGEGIIGECQPMRELFRRVEKVAGSDVPVLVLGESGTGKELIARSIHEQSARHDAPMVSVNCAAVAGNQIEMELFGQDDAEAEPGAGRRGQVELADGGTLFLDEIAELSMAAQGGLLKLLEDGTTRRLNGTGDRQVDVRIIAATHQNLAGMVQNGCFREDLYYRLNVVELGLPPLRERTEDIPALANAILSRLSERLNTGPMQFTDDAIEAMTAYSWPGNVRELENAIERAVILAEGASITADLLAIDPARSPKPSAHPASKTGDSQEELSLEDYFARFVLENQDNMTETELARKLGISRKCLWERRQRLGIPRKKSAATS